MQNKFSKQILPIAIILIIFVVSVILVRFYLPTIGADWIGVYMPAGQALMHGEIPYGITRLPFANPPWTLIPLLPFIFLPPSWGAATMFVLNICAYVFVAMKLKMPAWGVIIFLLFSYQLNNSFNGNIEGLVALGFLLPPQIGLFFVLSKPQIGIAVAVFWAVEAWRKGGWAEVGRVFSPVVLAFVFSFSIYGFWIFQSSQMVNVFWNSSIFPYGVPVGLCLLGLAVWKRDICFAIAASPFFAPYLTPHSWAFVWLGGLAIFGDWKKVLEAIRDKTFIRKGRAQKVPTS